MRTWTTARPVFLVSGSAVSSLARQRMPLMGRTADTGQRLQSSLLSAALVSDLISLAFLLHQQWRPYEKWREAMFARLPCAAELSGPLETAAAEPGGNRGGDAAWSSASAAGRPGRPGRGCAGPGQAGAHRGPAGPSAPAAASA